MILYLLKIIIHSRDIRVTIYSIYRIYRKCSARWAKNISRTFNTFDEQNE